MKRFFFAFCLILTVLLCVSAHAQSSALNAMRNKIFNECANMKELLKNQKDIIVINSMWSSGVLTVTQLDAYFSMVGIINAIKNEDLTEEIVGRLMGWLKEMKSTNELNIKSLDSITYKVEPGTKNRIEKFRDYFSNLSRIINGELNRVSALQKASRLKRRK